MVNTETFKKLDKNQRELILLALVKLLIQGQPAADNGSCKYRTDKGAKCAIGCLINDSDYGKELENNTADDHLVIDALKKSHPDVDYSRNFRDHLVELQIIHDGTTSNYYSIITVRKPEFRAALLLRASSLIPADEIALLQIEVSKLNLLEKKPDAVSKEYI
jgi:hypothetical protein